jgi:hypothetical protein
MEPEAQTGASGFCLQQPAEPGGMPARNVDSQVLV